MQLSFSKSTCAPPVSPIEILVKNVYKAGYSLSDMNILKLSDIGYASSYTSTEILRCMSSVVDNLKSELANSKVVTALGDESTDISNHKRLVIYAQIISEDMKPSTRFLTNIE